jgi:uncharacterized protein (TIGR02271 family)
MEALRGKTVYDRAGDKIGTVEDFYLDNETGEPEWLGVGSGIFRTKHILVPVQGYSESGDGITVPYEKDHVKDAPNIDMDEISEERERELYEFYGIRQLGFRDPNETYDPSQYRPATAAGMDRTDTDTARYETGRTADMGRFEGKTTDADASLVRNEEELKVGTRAVEAGRARLRKWVETESVSTDVPVRRETARVVREPVDRATTGAEIGEREVEMKLMREEPVVEKQTVARERVSLERQVEDSTERVEDTLSKERVEVEGVDGDVTRDDNARR